MTKAAISDRIREARRAAKLTQDQLAERLGISSQAVQQWESGRAKPDLDRLPAVARVLNVADAWLAWGMGLPERTANDTLLALSNARGGLSVPSVDHAAAAKDFRQAVNASTSQAFVHFPCSEEAFRIFVWDRSNAPRFKPGDSLIIDPQARPAPGDMVFAAAGLSREPIFGQLSIKRTDTGLVYQVAPLSESWPDHVVSAADIVGVMTEHAAQRR